MGSSRAQLVKWGNSHALRLPKKIVEEAHLREGQELEIRVDNGRIAIAPARPALTLDALVDAITAGNLPGEVDWGRRVGKEPW